MLSIILILGKRTFDFGNWKQSEKDVKMREKWIDRAKGIAMLLVIIGHVSGDLEGVWDFKFVYGIHLVMFFLLSGYTLKKKEITRRFINQRFDRLMVPYFYTCAAIILTDVFNSYYLNRDRKSVV